MDLEKEQELSMVVMNLIAIEEHLAFTIGKTKKEQYLDFYNAIRKTRSQFQKKLCKNLDGENWCVAKHLLVSTMHFLETGVKYGTAGDKKTAMELFENAVETYEAFWVLQQMAETKKVKRKWR